MSSNAKLICGTGHAHAGVLLIFSVIAQILIDQPGIHFSYELIMRIAFPIAVILIRTDAQMGMGSSGKTIPKIAANQQSRKSRR